MPSLFKIGGYRVFFWSNEAGEPVHVHVCLGEPRQDATKLWLTRSGGCVVASNGSKVPARDLAEIAEIVAAQHSLVVEKWKVFFDVDDIAFFC